MEEEAVNSELSESVAEANSSEPTQNITTLENVGKGLAFLGMLVFFLTVLFYFLSLGQPALYLFAGTSHLIIMSIIALIFVIVGYALTKVQPKSTD